MGTVPYGLRFPLIPLYTSLSLQCAYLSLMIFWSSFPWLWSPSSCFPPTPSLVQSLPSIFSPSLMASSFLHLGPFCFFSGFFFRGEFQIYSPVVGIAAPVQLCRKTNSHLGHICTRFFSILNFFCFAKVTQSLCVLFHLHCSCCKKRQESPSKISYIATSTIFSCFAWYRD